jgi:hypothetical protein
MKIVTSLVVLAMASPAWAEPTQVFPLTGPELGPERRGTVERLTRALADSIDAEVSSVAIEDAAGLLECDVEATSCLELVSKSVGNKQLEFGTVVQGKGNALKVTLTRFRPGPDRQQQTYELSGESEAYPDELVRKAAPLFGGTPPDEIEKTPEPIDPPVTPPVVDEPPAGTITAGTWGLIGGGAIGIAIGIGFRVSASGISDDVNAFPQPQTRDDFDRLTALEDRGTLHTRLGVGFIVAGGVALGAGIIRAVVQRQSPSQDERVVSVTPLRGGAAITVTWGLR